MQWWIQGGSFGSVEPPFLSFCAHASPASCVHTSAVENVLDSGTPPFLDPLLLWEVLVSDLRVVLSTVGVPRVYKVGPVGDHVVRQLQL